MYSTTEGFMKLNVNSKPSETNLMLKKMQDLWGIFRGGGDFC